MLTDAQKNALRFCECGHIFISHGIRGCDLCGGCKVLPRTINTTETAIAALIASEVQQATTYLARGQRRSVSLLADAQAELATARVTNDRLNRRVQIAESALNELNGNGQGAPNKIQREAWTRHQEAQAKLDRLRTGITALAKERGSQQASGVKTHCGRRLRALLDGGE